MKQCVLMKIILLKRHTNYNLFTEKDMPLQGTANLYIAAERVFTKNLAEPSDQRAVEQAVTANI